MGQTQSLARATERRRAVARVAVRVGSVIGLSVLLVAPPCAADERASAEELFQLGRAAMERGELPRACQLLEASLKLEDTLGTLLNVALCHEKAGRFATAWGEFRAVEQRALRSSPPATGRATFAREHAEKVRPRVSRLYISLAEGLDARRVEVRVDGVVQAPALWSVGVPVDPGRRTVRASARGKLPVELGVDVAAGAPRASLIIPALEDEKAPPASTALPAEADPSASARRTAGYITGGIGLGFVAAGAVFGGLALSARSDATCPAPCTSTLRNGAGAEVPNPRLQDATDAYDRANVLANLSTVAFIVGAFGVGAGVYLVLTGRSSSAPGESRGAAAWIGPSGAGVGGRF